MTEKRFSLINGVKPGTHSGVWDNLKQHNQGVGDELWVGEVVDWLNELHEKNQQSTIIVKRLKEQIQELKKDNQRLKEREIAVKNTIDRLEQME